MLDGGPATDANATHLRCSQQGTLYLPPCDVSSMHNAAIAVPSLASQVQAAILVAGELCTQLGQLQHCCRPLTTDSFHSPAEQGSL